MEPVNITVYYDKELQKITGSEKEPVVISSSAIFVYLLHILFTSYPDIERKYPPGTIGLLLNGRRPSEFDTFENGDEVRLVVVKETVSN